MSFRKISQFVNERLSLFVGVGLIISIHWGWYKLQQVPYLVDQTESKELPIIRAVKVFHSKLMNHIGSNSESNLTNETTQKSK